MNNFEQVQMIKLKNALEDEKFHTHEVTLLNSGWTTIEPFTQTQTIQGVTATNIVIASPTPTKENMEMASDCKINVTEQSENTLKFTAFDAKPTTNVTYNILVGGEG